MSSSSIDESGMTHRFLKKSKGTNVLFAFGAHGCGYTPIQEIDDHCQLIIKNHQGVSQFLNDP